MSIRRLAAVLILSVAGTTLAAAASAESYDPGLFRELRWRMIGPHRGGRTKAAAGIPDRPAVFYVGAVNGGVWKTDDAGRTWTPIFDDQPTGSIGAIALAPSNPDVVYVGSGEGLQRPDLSTGDGIYKSTDGGETWRPIVKGLPTFAEDGLGRIGITVAPSQPRRLFATVEAKKKAGLYRSDDAGESWTLVNADPRVTERASDFAEVKVHPQDPDTVFTASIVTWKSTDGGRTFTALRGAPGGDDYHRIWINPRQPDIMLIAADQGVIITVNGGRSWSSWY